MRIVADTNIVVSGLLWSGPSRAILDLARQATIELFTTLLLLAELEDVLIRPKFQDRLHRAQVQPQDLVIGYAASATLVTPAAMALVVAADPDDDAVLACAIAAQANIIVSGDRHLLDLQHFRNIPIVTAATLVSQLTP